MMGLPGRKPKIVKNKKAKIILSGKSGIGKSLFSCQFPNAYYWDTEDGASREQYQKLMIDNDSNYVCKEDGSESFKSLINAVKELATTKHNYKTLVIDSLSHLYLLEAAIAEEKVGNAFSADKKEAEKPSRQLKRWLDKLDMNVIMICYYDTAWETINGVLTNVGTKFIGPKFIDHLLDLWIEARVINGKRMFEVKKTRIDKFELGMIKPLNYKTFSELYGVDIMESEAKQIILATDEQVKQLRSIIKEFGISEEVQKKWLKKADVDYIEDFPKEIIQKIIDNYYKKEEVPK